MHAQSLGVKQAEGLVDLAEDAKQKEVEAVLKALAAKAVVRLCLLPLPHGHYGPRRYQEPVSQEFSPHLRTLPFRKSSGL